MPRERSPGSRRRLADVLFWVLVVATIGLYAAIVGWSIPSISNAAGGQPAFDMRPLGYSYAEAEAFVRKLTPDGTEFYLRVQHRLDLLYPALLAVTTAWALLRLVPRWRARWLLALAPMPGLLFDYLENRAVATMLVTGADGLTPEMAARASLFSQLKAFFNTLSLSLLLILILAWAFRRWRAGKPGH